MATAAFLAILLSALCHAVYNAFVKTSSQKTLFYWAIYAVASVVILTLAPFLPARYVLPEHASLFLYAGLSALFYTLYHLATGRAYTGEEGHLSLSYPLSTTAPLYIPVLAYLFFDEVIPLTALFGIAVVLMGVMAIQIGSPERLRRPVAFRSASVRYALLAAFLYSFGAIADKQGVISSNYYVFTSYVILFMFVMLSLVMLARPSLRAQSVGFIRQFPRQIAIGGLILYASFFLFRYALETASISYAASVRQVSSLFAVYIGVRFLGEPYGMLRFLATLIIIAGIALIKTS